MEFKPSTMRTCRSEKIGLICNMTLTLGQISKLTFIGRLIYVIRWGSTTEDVGVIVIPHGP